MTLEVNNHVHSTYSFSPYTPQEIPQKAKEAGLGTVGIMDHDSVSGCAQFLEACKKVGIPARVIHDWHDEHRPEVWFKMVEAEDLLLPGDQRYSALREELEDGSIRFIPLGGHARPLTAEDLD